MSKRFTFADIEAAPTVRIYHAKCGKPWYFAVDMPDMKREIDQAIAKGTRAGDRVVFYEPKEEPHGEGYCKCFQVAS